MTERLARWLLFSVIISLLPIIFICVLLLTDGKKDEIASVLARGELLLVSVALAADAVGDQSQQAEKTASGRYLPVAGA